MNSSNNTPRGHNGSNSSDRFDAFDAFGDDDDFDGDLGGNFEVIGADGKAISIEGPSGSGSGSSSASSSGSASAEDDGRVRLQKVLASAGVASRRASEDLIIGGKVRVNGTVVRELGTRIDPSVDKVAVNNVAVQLDASKVYFVLNKPTGVVSTMKDENGRDDLRRFTNKLDARVFNVGRLDAETSGLLVLTNDGDLAHVLAHPSFGVMKTYIAKVRGRVTAQTIQKLITGIELDDGPINADKARLLESNSDTSLVEITLHSGRNRIVRRMLAEVGHPVIDLVRRSFGPLRLGSLRAGAMRELTREELGALLTLSRGEVSKSARRYRPRNKNAAKGDAS